VPEIPPNDGPPVIRETKQRERINPLLRAALTAPRESALTAPGESVLTAPGESALTAPGESVLERALHPNSENTATQDAGVNRLQESVKQMDETGPTYLHLVGTVAYMREYYRSEGEEISDEEIITRIAAAAQNKDLLSITPGLSEWPSLLERIMAKNDGKIKLPGET